MRDSTRRWLPIAVVTLALILLGWVVSTAQLSAHSVPVPNFRGHADDPSVSSDSRSASTAGATTHASQAHLGVSPLLAEVIAILVDVIVVGLVVAIVAFLVYRLVVVRPARRAEAETRAASQPSAEEMRQVLRAGLSDIDAGGDPRRVVISCWLRLEHAADAAGAGRLESETPTDLVVRLLTSFEVSDRALEALTAAYHHARYAPDAVDATEMERARSALAEVDAQLAAAQLRAETESAS